MSSISFAQEWKALSDSDKETLKTWAEEEMTILGIEGQTALKYIKSQIG